MSRLPHGIRMPGRRRGIMNRIRSFLRNSRLGNVGRRDCGLHSTKPWLMLGMLSAAFGICAEALGDMSNQFAAFNPSFFGNGEGGTSVDLSRFENGNPVDPGNYRLDVYVNGNWIGRQD